MYNTKVMSVFTDLLLLGEGSTPSMKKRLRSTVSSEKFVGKGVSSTTSVSNTTKTNDNIKTS
jgi:hypothetical protein